MKPSLFEPAGEAPQAELPMPATFIPPAPERTARAAAHAAHRRTAAAGAERDQGAARRACRGSPREAPHVADAAAGLGRPWPARGGGRGAAGAAHRTADAAIRASAAAADRPPSGRPHLRPSRCRNMPGAPLRRGSTPMAGRRLCIIRPRRTNSISRPSCAARPTDGRLKAHDGPVPDAWSGAVGYLRLAGVFI